MDVGIQFEVQDMVGSFEERRVTLLAMLTAKIDELAGLFVARVKERLSGELLNVHSGKLIGSVNATPAAVHGAVIEAMISAGGEAAPYGVIQELGVAHDWKIAPVDKQVLRFMLEGQTVFSTFAKHGPLPPRPFMELTAEEMQEQILTEIEATVQQAME